MHLWEGDSIISSSISKRWHHAEDETSTRRGEMLWGDDAAPFSKSIQIV